MYPFSLLAKKGFLLHPLITRVGSGPLFNYASESVCVYVYVDGARYAFRLFLILRVLGEGRACIYHGG